MEPMRFRVQQLDHREKRFVLCTQPSAGDPWRCRVVRAHQLQQLLDWLGFADHRDAYEIYQQARAAVREFGLGSGYIEYDLNREQDRGPERLLGTLRPSLSTPTAQKGASILASVRFLRFLRAGRRGVYMAGTGDEYESQDERERREAEARFHASLRDVSADSEGGPYTCPCCGHRTLPSRGNYDLCPNCGWEDDGQDDHDSHLIRLGPNGGLSLDAAREVYRRTRGHPQPHTPPADPR